MGVTEGGGGYQWVQAGGSAPNPGPIKGRVFIQSELATKEREWGRRGWGWVERGAEPPGNHRLTAHCGLTP